MPVNRTIPPEGDILVIKLTQDKCGKCGGTITFDSQLGRYHVCVSEVLA